MLSLAASANVTATAIKRQYTQHWRRCAPIFGCLLVSHNSSWSRVPNANGQAGGGRLAASDKLHNYTSHLSTTGSTTGDHGREARSVRARHIGKDTAASSPRRKPASLAGRSSSASAPWASPCKAAREERRRDAGTHSISMSLLTPRATTGAPIGARRAQTTSAPTSIPPATTAPHATRCPSARRQQSASAIDRKPRRLASGAASASSARTTTTTSLADAQTITAGSSLRVETEAAASTNRRLGAWR